MNGMAAKEKTLIIDSSLLKQGFTAAPNAVLYDSRISVQARWLYCILLSFAWQENECWPGQERLSKVAGWHLNTVEKYLKELREYGLISWKRQGLNRPNIYFIHEPSKALIYKDSQAGVNPESQGSVNPDSQASVILDSHLRVKEEYSDEEDVVVVKDPRSEKSAGMAKQQESSLPARLEAAAQENSPNNAMEENQESQDLTSQVQLAEGGRVPQTLPCNEMPGVGYHRPYLGSGRPYVGSEVHSKNTKLRITSEEDVVVVKAASGEDAGRQQEPTQCVDMVTSLPASTGPVLQEVPPVNTEGDGNKPGTTGNEQDRPESLEVPETDAKVKIQELFIKTAGYPLPEAALNELASYPPEYVEQKIKMLESGKEKANTVGWLLEACREDYQHLPGPKPPRKVKPKPPRSPGNRTGPDKYRELYRLV